MLRSSRLMIGFPFFAFIQLKVTWSGQQNKSFFTYDYDYAYVSMFSPCVDLDLFPVPLYFL